MKKVHRFHKIVHHIKHTRPQWYYDYHAWEHHNTLHWITFGLSTMVMFLGFINAVMLMQRYPIGPADAATTTVSQTVNAGTLNISPQASASLSTVTVNAAASQNSAGDLGTVTVTDNRGSGVGWSATAASSDFTFVNAAVKTSGSNNTFTRDSSSTYNTSTAGTYTITITTGGTVGAAKFSVAGLESASDQTTGASVAIGTSGVTGTFASATYVIGDSWTIRIDTIPVTNLLFTPNTFTTIAGSSTGVSNGSAHTFTTTSDATAIMTATTGNGMGSYSDNPALQLTVPAAAYANSYTATITETVN